MSIVKGIVFLQVVFLIQCSKQTSHFASAFGLEGVRAALNKYNKGTRDYFDSTPISSDQSFSRTFLLFPKNSTLQDKEILDTMDIPTEPEKMLEYLFKNPTFMAQVSLIWQEDRPILFWLAQLIYGCPLFMEKREEAHEPYSPRFDVIIKQILCHQDVDGQCEKIVASKFFEIRKDYQTPDKSSMDMLLIVVLAILIYVALHPELAKPYLQKLSQKYEEQYGSRIRTAEPVTSIRRLTRFHPQDSYDADMDSVQTQVTWASSNPTFNSHSTQATEHTSVSTNISTRIASLFKRTEATASELDTEVSIHPHIGPSSSSTASSRRKENSRDSTMNTQTSSQKSGQQMKQTSVDGAADGESSPDQMVLRSGFTPNKNKRPTTPSRRGKGRTAS